jgi:hemerythrin
MPSGLFDNAHLLVVEQINLLLLAIVSGDVPRTRLAHASLSVALHDHFADEERQMCTTSYREIDVHREQHLELVAQVSELLQPETCYGTAGIAAARACYHAFAEHVIADDRRLASFLLGRGQV